MPIIIHRQDPIVTTGPAPNASNDWDKAVGAVVMVAGGWLLIKELTFAGDLAALASWLSNTVPTKPGEMTQVWTTIGLLAARGLALGALNVLSGWGIWSKSEWAFLFAAIINVAGLLILLLVLHDFQEEYLAIGVGVAGYGIARLCGALEPKT